MRFLHNAIRCFGVAVLICQDGMVLDPRRRRVNSCHLVCCYARTCKPCFSTIFKSLSAIPLGLLAPVSHFSTVLSLVFK